VSGNNLFAANINSATVGQYNATTGAAINLNVITGFIPYGVAVSGSNLFVTNLGMNTVGQYNATTGASINIDFISGLSSPHRTRLVGEQPLRDKPTE
jgi:hypothetical protein